MMDNHLDFDNDQFKIRIATKDDIAAVDLIMREASKSLPNKDMFVADSLEWIRKMLSDDKKALGIIAVNSDSNEAAGFLIVTFKDAFDEENYGFDLGFDEYKRARTANMESAAVSSSARGHHLESRMLDYARHCLNERYIYLIATVSPDNPASIRSLERCGYKRMLTKEKYGGKMRHIYLNTL